VGGVKRLRLKRKIEMDFTGGKFLRFFYGEKQAKEIATYKN
jgi:hypothetical protein